MVDSQDPTIPHGNNGSKEDTASSIDRAVETYLENNQYDEFELRVVEQEILPMVKKSNPEATILLVQQALERHGYTYADDGREEPIYSRLLGN